MRGNEPPSIATWMLRHCIPGRHNDALAGDLLEEFRSGRSIGWYWRQVLDAILIGCFREILDHRTVALYAVLWSMLAPAWVLIITSLKQHSGLNQHILKMDWPWSTVFDLGLLLAANLLFIWAGILLYLIPRMWTMRNLRIQPLSRGIRASLPALVLVYAALVALPLYFLSPGDQPLPVSTYKITSLHPFEVARVPPQEEWISRYGDKVVERAISPRDEIIDMRKSAIALRLPFFVVILCGLWGAVAPARRDPKEGAG